MALHDNTQNGTFTQLAFRWPKAQVRKVPITFVACNTFEFAGCVNITHRAPNQFSYRYGRKVSPPDWTLT